MNPINPGKEIGLGDGLTAVVFPLAIKHLPEVTARLSTLVRLAAVSGAMQGKKSDLVSALPAAATDLIDIVAKCTTVTFNGEPVEFGELGHEHFPPIFDAWMQESFDGGKWKAWVTVINSTITRVTGKPFSISETLSKHSSPPAIPE